MESAPFHWRPADASHLAETLRRTGAAGMRQAAGFAFAAGIVALCLIAASTSTGTVWALMAILVGAMVPAAIYWGMSRWIARWLRYHADCHITAAWDDAGYSTFGCRHSEPSRVAWNQVSRTIETGRYLIILTRLGPFFLPLEALEGRALEDIRMRFDQHGITRIVDTRPA